MNSSKKLLRVLVVLGLLGGFLYLYRMDSTSKVDMKAIESGLPEIGERDGVEFTSKGLAQLNTLLEDTRPTIPPPTVAIPPEKALAQRKPQKPKTKLPEVQVFRSRSCETCDRLEEYLQDQGVVFERILADTDSGKALFKKYGLRKVPMVRIGDKNYVGNDPVLLSGILKNYENPSKGFVGGGGR